MERRKEKFNKTRDEIEKKESITERANKTATSRLKQQHQIFEESHDLIANEINEEIKRLQDDLRGIRQVVDFDITKLQHANRDSSTSLTHKRKKLIFFKKKSNTVRKLKNNDEKDSQVKLQSSETFTTSGYNTQRNVALKSNYTQTQTRHFPLKVSGQVDKAVHHATCFDENETKASSFNSQEYRKHFERTSESTKHETLPFVTRSNTLDSRYHANLT